MLELSNRRLRRKLNPSAYGGAFDMERVVQDARPQWRERCESVGFSFYDMPSEGGRPYWNETAAYKFNDVEIGVLEGATQELIYRTFDAAEHVVRKRRFREFGIPEKFWGMVTDSWDQDDPTVYGRFDLAYNGTDAPKMLEYNADTPTSLLESSVVQWQWMTDVKGDGFDQFNSIHEQLVDQWRHIRVGRWMLDQGATLHFASLHDAGDGELLVEDFENMAYMAETAKQAGFEPKLLHMEDIGWNGKQFTDLEEQPIEQIFKLYPWEWMVNEEFGDKILESRDTTRWVEPIWKMLLSNKQLLVVMHELFPTHPNILPAYNGLNRLFGSQFVRKPKLSREGANVEVRDARGNLLEAQDGDYGDEGYIFQAYANLAHFAGKNAVIGSWVVGETPAGIDMRETSTLITGNMAEFVPHYIEK